MEAASAHSTSGAQRREQGGRRPQAEQPTSSRAVLSCPEDTQSELGDVETGRGGSAAIAVHTPAAAVKATSGRAKRKERRLRNEPQNVTGAGPSGIHVLDFAEARATEMSVLLKALASKRSSQRVFQELPPHMRRRAMSHSIKRLPRRLRATAQREMEKSNTQVALRKKAPHSRHHRRRLPHLREEFANRQRDKKWLETHLWHAKRMKMVEQYGFRLADHANDKGVRASFRSLAYGCLLSDISYHCCIEIEGRSQSDIIAAVNPLFSSEAGLTLKAVALLSGQREGKAVVFKPDSSPRGAIGPVQFLWQPPTPQELSKVESTTSVVKLWVWSHPAIHDQLLGEVQQAIKRSQDSRISLSAQSLKLDLIRFRLIGPRSHALLMETLKHSFQFKDNDKGPPTISSSLGELPEGFYWWKHHAPTIAHQKLFSRSLPSISTAQTPASFPRGTVVGATVVDPRLFTPSKRTDMVSAFYPPRKKSRWAAATACAVEQASSSWSAPQRDEGIGPELEDDSFSSGDSGEDGEGGEGGEGGEAERSIDEEIEEILVDSADDGMLQDSRDDSVPDGSCVPVFSSGVTVPHLPSEASYSALWSHDVRETASKCKIHERHLNTLRSQSLVRQPQLKLGDKAARVPVILIQQTLELSPIPTLSFSSSSSSFSADFLTDANLGTGWDLILPKEWAMPFWVSLIYRGARACGMRELKKCSLEALTLHFPEDYPDTDAGRDHSSARKAALEARYIRYPPDKRRNYGKLLIPSPFCAPWGDLVDSWQKRSLSTKHLDRKGSTSYDELTPEPKRAKIEVLSCVDLDSPVKRLKGDATEASTPHHITSTSCSTLDSSPPPPPPLDHPVEAAPSPPLLSPPETGSYHVLRSRDALHTLRQFVEHLFAAKEKQISRKGYPRNPTTPTSVRRLRQSAKFPPTSAAMLKACETQSASDSEKPELDTEWKRSLQDFDICHLLQTHSRAVVAVRFELLQGSGITEGASLSLPDTADLCTLVSLQRERPFSGPKEIINPKGMTVVTGNQISVGLSALSRKEMNEVKVQRKVLQKNHKQGSRGTMTTAIDAYKLCRATPTRVAIGYVTSAGYRLHSSHCGGCGFVALAGLVEAIGKCFREPRVGGVMCLARGETVQYYFARVQIM